MQSFQHQELGNANVFSEAETIKELQDKMNEVTVDMETRGYTETGSVIFNGKLPKKMRKLLRGGNAQVEYSMERGDTIGDYVGANPVYVNKAGPHQIPNFVKVQAGIPFVKPALHNLEE